MSFDNFLDEIEGVDIWKYINKDRFIKESMWEITDTKGSHPKLKHQDMICDIFYERYKSK